jgi:TfoX/Sxy family transcriptional regulator of competence genes
VAYDEALAARIDSQLSDRGDTCTSKKMFGGIAWMHREHMFIGIVKDELMVRVGPDAQDAALRGKGVRPMDFTGRPLKGYVYVEPSAFRTKKQLDGWISAGMGFVSTLPPKKKRKPKPRVKTAASKKKAAKKKAAKKKAAKKKAAKKKAAKTSTRKR